MKHSLHSLLKRKWVSAGFILMIALGLCAWLFGWGGGDINVIPFDADDVEHIELSGIYRGAIRSAYLTEPEDIQAMIDSVNSFRYSGSGLKDIFKYGIGIGGTSPYEIMTYRRSFHGLLWFKQRRSGPIGYGGGLSGLQ